MESVRKLYDRMAAMGGEITVPEIYTAKTMELVQQRKAIIVTDMMTGRVQSSLFCPVLNGFFYVGTQILTSLRSVWYFRNGIDPAVTREIDKRLVNLKRAILTFKTIFLALSEVSECTLPNDVPGKTNICLP